MTSTGTRAQLVRTTTTETAATHVKTNNYHLAELEEGFDQPNTEDEADEREYQEYKRVRKLKKQQKRERKEQKAKEKQEKKSAKKRMVPPSSPKDKRKEPSQSRSGSMRTAGNRVNPSHSDDNNGDENDQQEGSGGEQGVNLGRSPSARRAELSRPSGSKTSRHRSNRVIRLFLRRRLSGKRPAHYQELELEPLRGPEEQDDPHREQPQLGMATPGVATKGGYWHRVWSKIKPSNRTHSRYIAPQKDKNV